MQALKRIMPALVRVVVIDGATHSGERGALKRPEFTQAVREFIGSHALTPIRVMSHLLQSNQAMEPTADRRTLHF
jgi:hypothetical protein